MSLVAAVAFRRDSRSPQAWVYVVGAAGWMVLAVETLRDLRGQGSMPMAGMGPAAETLGWLAMIAVMLPLVAPNLRGAGLRSPRRSRVRITLQVGAAWAAVWLPVAALLATLAWSAGLLGRPLVVVLVATGLAVTWQWTPAKARSIVGCHRLLAPPLGRRAGARAARRYGVELGLACAVGCAPMMMLMAVAGHDVLVAAPLVAVAWHERRRRAPYDPAPLATSLVIAAVGALALAGA